MKNLNKELDDILLKGENTGPHKFMVTGEQYNRHKVDEMDPTVTSACCARGAFDQHAHNWETNKRGSYGGPWGRIGEGTSLSTRKSKAGHPVYVAEHEESKHQAVPMDPNSPKDCGRHKIEE